MAKLKDIERLLNELAKAREDLIKIDRSLLGCVRGSTEEALLDYHRKITIVKINIYSEMEI